MSFHLVYCVSLIYSSSNHLYCHICDSKQYLPYNFSFTLSITQTMVSPLGAVPHLHLPCLKSVVSPLSPLSCKPCSPPLHLYLICHIFYVVSIHHATFCKQTLSPIAPSPQALFFSLSLSTFCHLLLHPFLSPHYPLQAHTLLHPLLYPSHQPTLPSVVYHLPLNCHTCYFLLLSSLASFSYTVLSPSDGYAILSQRVRAMQNIKSEAHSDVPSSTESVYLAVATIPTAAGCICSPHLAPHSHSIVLTTATSR